MKRVQLFLAAIIIVFASCEQNGPKEPMGSLNGHECVDLGLSVKWATMNVGAETPEQSGHFFAWGETKVKSTYSSETYYYKHNNRPNLSLSNDAAHVHWGGRWRMPTEDDWKELQAYCTWELTQQNDVYGYKISSMTNQNSIFLPVTRAPYRNTYFGTNHYPGYYWSSNFRDGNYIYLYFDEPNQIGREVTTFGWQGYAVRPVCK